MGKTKASDLSDLLAALAKDSIDTQVRFNEAHKADIERFEALVAAADPTVKQFLGALLPSRMHLDTFEPPPAYRLFFPIGQEHAAKESRRAQCCSSDVPLRLFGRELVPQRQSKVELPVHSRRSRERYSVRCAS